MTSATVSGASGALAEAAGDGRVRRDENGRRAVRLWLWIVALGVVAMVIVGGATRMTESGLSITEWKPIHGVIPPLSQAEWDEEFLKYQQIPQFHQLNSDMTLDGFKTIFWWEWAHRLLGRLIGVVFLVPFLAFAARGWIRRDMLPRIGLLFVLGGLQGAIGWWMVASGLSERTEVSQYRLAVHLTLACFILMATVWIAESFRGPGRVSFAEPKALRRTAKLLVGLILAQIFLGGLVAGLRAGLVYNTWPLMDGALIPDGLMFMSPGWVNFFENHLTVQFVHRCGAYLLLAVAVFHVLQVRSQALDPASVRRAVLVLGAILVQAIIGIATLVMVVPIELGLLHQGAAAIVLIIATIHAHRLSERPAAGAVIRPHAAIKTA
ncbi:COX15/CtaA family protein [Methylobrevis pamukkalensis]|uniref:Heme A synthase n=1 Tax=Methylobrevis pamukkalensis TaxID=1439726 RepID=A0A1E3GY96_9HYPH|nr:COX15/CtaA family protein [Methylobrevis pamukkalensis]ODN69013.1 Heme A synthase [Methylobrevis pamukkalensis]